jgi:hypothetical protein
MKRIRFAARIYSHNGAEFTSGGYSTLRRAIRGARAECTMIGGTRYYIHRWCPYTGYAEIVAGSDVPKSYLMRLAELALGVTSWLSVIAGVPQ